ncbi:hypothetical protein, conserved [Leishmania tarentolae]|uniref:Uncharacterized protein n=1 Tax=Leishmania tarentolae TaxID=5689 RepID=A0A640KCP1_LEITA|nr:hypothetical protein, conserved [Leishmania tarentolae]
MEYCTSYRHTCGANAGLAAGREGSAPSSNVSCGSEHPHSGEGALLVDDKKETNASHSNKGNENLPLAHSKPSALVSCAEASIPEDSRQRCNSATKSKEGIDVDRAASAVGGVREKMQQEVVMSGVIITREDLAAMKATDCSVEEVNDLFRKDFDIHKYLRGSWPQYVLERQQQEQHGAVAVTTAASGSGGKQTTVESTYMLRLPDVLQMLIDVQATLAEVTVRMNAMAKSAVLEAGLQPPLEPPSHPEQPCPLCSRRDTCELERHRRREAMSRIARDLQKKMEAVEAKSRAALTERDEALGEVRRLKMELQHSATVTSARGPAVIGAAQQQQQQDMHSGSQGHRHQRQTSADTTAEAPSGRHTPAWNFEGGTSSPDNSSSDMTMVTGRSVNSPNTSAVMFSESKKFTVPLSVSGASVGASMSLQQSSVSFYGDAPVAGSFSTVSYEEVDHAAMPSQRRFTAEMVPKWADSADHDSTPPSLSVTDVNTSALGEVPFNALASDLAGSHADGGGVTRGVEQGEEARQQRRRSPSDGASDSASAAEMPKGGHP